jgi:hypothetical protein
MTLPLLAVLPPPLPLLAMMRMWFIATFVLVPKIKWKMRIWYLQLGLARDVWNGDTGCCGLCEERAEDAAAAGAAAAAGDAAAADAPTLSR